MLEQIEVRRCSCLRWEHRAAARHLRDGRLDVLPAAAKARFSRTSERVNSGTLGVCNRIENETVLVPEIGASHGAAAQTPGVPGFASRRVPSRAAALLLALVLPWLACGSQRAGPKPPNIILIVADALRSDYLGFRGFEGGISPNLDRLATEAVQFENCVAAAPWTKPSIASLFTSLDPERHGLTQESGLFGKRGGEIHRTQRLSDRAETLAERLRDAGYTTAARVSNPWIMAVNGFSQGFDDWRGVKSGGTGTAQEIIGALEQLRDREPFFLYLHFMEVHGPYGGWPGSEGAFEILRSSPSLGTDHVITPAEADARPSYLGENIGWGRPEDGRHLNSWRAAYALGVLSLDQLLGSVFEWLRQTEVLDDSVLVFTSDHGEEFLEHGVWEHGRTLCSHQLHVPLLIRYPAARWGGSVVHGLVRTLDLMPTLLAVAGSRSPAAGLRGVDLAPILRGETQRAVPFAYATGVKGQPWRKSIRNERYKLVADLKTQEFELFDLVGDPQERSPAGDVPASIVAELRQELQARAAPANPAEMVEESDAEALREDLGALRALGYLE